MAHEFLINYPYKNHTIKVWTSLRGPFIVLVEGPYLTIYQEAHSTHLIEYVLENEIDSAIEEAKVESNDTI